jgi:hypothetical protein
MRPFFSSGGGVGATMEAARGRRRRLAWLRCGSKKTTGGRLGRDGGLGRPRGRGPVGEGRENRPVEKKENGPWLGQKAGWAESDGKISFPNNI